MNQIELKYGASRFRQELSDLLDLCFGLSSGFHFLDDFPVWDPQFASPEVRIFTERRSGILRAACGIRLVILRVKTRGGDDFFKVRVALLGAVCCHPLWRGQGLASKLIAEGIQWARDQGAAAIFLWGAQEQLYRRQGFFSCGRQVRLPLVEVMRAEFPGMRGGLEVRGGLTAELFDLLTQRVDGSALSSQDWNWYGHHKNVQWYFTEKRGRPTAYAAVGRGIDLEGHVHEWGGEPSDLKAVFESILVEHPQAIWLGPSDVPAGQGASPSRIDEFLCMAKILEPMVFLHPIPGVDEPGNWTCQKLPTGWKFQSDKSELVVAEPDLVQALFGKSGEIEAPHPGSFGHYFKALRLWFWGLDAA